MQTGMDSKTRKITHAATKEAEDNVKCSIEVQGK
jgi:hypothetical protein